MYQYYKIICIALVALTFNPATPVSVHAIGLENTQTQHKPRRNKWKDLYQTARLENNIPAAAYILTSLIAKKGRSLGISRRDVSDFKTLRLLIDRHEPLPQGKSRFVFDNENTISTSHFAEVDKKNPHHEETSLRVVMGDLFWTTVGVPIFRAAKTLRHMGRIQRHEVTDKLSIVKNKALRKFLEVNEQDWSDQFLNKVADHLATLDTRELNKRYFKQRQGTVLRPLLLSTLMFAVGAHPVDIVSRRLSTANTHEQAIPSPNYFDHIETKANITLKQRPVRVIVDNTLNVAGLKYGAAVDMSDSPIARRLLNIQGTNSVRIFEKIKSEASSYSVNSISSIANLNEALHDANESGDEVAVVVVHGAPGELAVGTKLVGRYVTGGEWLSERLNEIQPLDEGSLKTIILFSCNAADRERCWQKPIDSIATKFADQLFKQKSGNIVSAFNPIEYQIAERKVSDAERKQINMEQHVWEQIQEERINRYRDKIRENLFPIMLNQGVSGTVRHALGLKQIDVLLRTADQLTQTDRTKNGFAVYHAGENRFEEHRLDTDEMTPPPNWKDRN